MNKIIRFFGVFLLAMLAIGVWSIAEDITLTTYYPAPYGAYDELSTTGNTYLATSSGNVGIGTTSPRGKLEVKGGYLFLGNSRSVILTRGDNDTTHIGGFQFLTYDNGTNNIWTPTNQNGVPVDSTVRFGGFGAFNANIVNIAVSGKVGIGVASPVYQLDVGGDINTTGDVRKNGTAYLNPDYVFEPAYLLMPLTELRNFVMEHKHLPRMPSKEDIANSGVAIFEQNRLILEKLEEAYLYIFELEKRIEKLERR